MRTRTPKPCASKSIRRRGARRRVHLPRRPASPLRRPRREAPRLRLEPLRAPAGSGPALLLPPRQRPGPRRHRPQPPPPRRGV